MFEWNTRRDSMKNCDKCERFFDLPHSDSPCAKCVNEKWGSGFKRASIKTRVRILKRRLKMVLQR